jgi:hypothetical protein
MEEISLGVVYENLAYLQQSKLLAYDEHIYFAA